MARKKIKLKEAIQGYMLRCQSKGLSLRTREWYEQKLTCFWHYAEDQLQITDLSAITLWHLRAFVVALAADKTEAGAAQKEKMEIAIQPRKNGKVADLTVKGYVQVLKGFFTWCVHEELLKESPAAKLENPKVGSYIIPTFEASQIQALLAACDRKTALGYRDYTMMFLLLDTGIRLSELCNLRLDDIHKNYIKVLGKGSKEREVGIHPQTAQHLWKYVNKFRHAHDENERRVFLNRYGKPLTKSGVAQAIADVGSRAGLSGVRVSPHTFRHTFARMYLDNGGDVYKLSRSLGHSEIGTTEEYLKDFKSREARREHDTYSPINSLKQAKTTRPAKSDGLFE